LVENVAGDMSTECADEPPLSSQSCPTVVVW
jgi:hypothetical protein